MKRWWRLLWIVAASVLPGAPGHGVPLCPLPVAPSCSCFGTDPLANGNPIGSGGDSYQYQPLDRLVSGDGGAIALGWDAASSPPAASPPQAEERGREWWGTVHPGCRSCLADPGLLSATPMRGWGAGARCARGEGRADGETRGYGEAAVNASGWAEVVEEHQSVNGGAATLTAVYTHGLDLIAQRRAGSVRYFSYDGHGSTRLLTDASGAVTDTYLYDAYGTLLTSSGSTPNNSLYCGEQFDPDLGMYYLRARFYQPQTGRFWTMDSWEGTQTDPLSLHKYLYADDDPVNFIDPSGHSMIGDVMLSVSIRVWMFAQVATRYVVYTAAAAGTVYIVTGTAIWVDDAYFGGTHTDSLYALRDGSGAVFFIAYFVASAGQAVALTPSQRGTPPPPSRTIQVSRSQYPRSAQHIQDSQASGRPVVLTVDRSGAAQRRAESLRSVPRVQGTDRDEYPPAVFREGGDGSTIRHIPLGDNRGAGATIGQQLRDVPDGATVRLEVVD